MAVCNKNASDASTVWTRDLSTDDKNELLSFCQKHKFEGSGFGETDVLNLDGAIMLTMLLPGKFARTIRLKAVNLLKKWIHENTSDPLLREMAVQPAKIESGKREREDELMCMDPDVAERRLAIKERFFKLKVDEYLFAQRVEEASTKIQENIREMKMASHERIVKIYQSQCTGGILDDRAKIMFNDMAMKIANSSSLPTGLINGQQVITNGSNDAKHVDTEVDPEGCPRSISDIVTEMGLRFSSGDIIKIGALAASKYRERYPGQDPKKHPQWVGGRECQVNHYMTKDHDIVKAAITELKAEK